jgi:uncharacterized protein
MRGSAYNLFVDDGERVLAVNLLSRTAMEWPPAAHRKFAEWSSGGAVDVDDEEQRSFAEELVRSLFLVPEDLDELALIRRHSEAVRFAGRQLGLVITPTMGCNFACHYCYEEKTDTYLGEEDQQRLVALVGERLATYDELSVQWFGGEPLRGLPIIQRLSREFLRLCAEGNKPFSATLVTNGFELTGEVAEELRRLGLKRVQITFDGDRELHDRTRTERGGNGSFDRIVQNILAMPASLELDVRVHVSPFSMPSVERLITRLAEFQLQDRITAVYFAPLFNYRVGMPGKAYRPDGRRFATSAEFAAMQVRLLRQLHEAGFRTKDWLDVSYGICTAVRADTIVVDASAALLKCYKDVGNSPAAYGTLAAGANDPAKERQWLDVQIPRDDECRACKFLPVCLGGCTKQWQEGADKAVICTPLRFNYEERIRLSFASPA